MAAAMQIGVITNPHSRKNRHRPDRVERVRELVGDMGLVRQTTDVEGIRPIMDEFVERGVRYWVSDGGDGTFHWMLNAGHDALQARGGDGPRPLLVPTNGGTIDFVAKKARIGGAADQIIKALVAGVRADQPFQTTTMSTLEVVGRRTGENDSTFHRLGFAAALGGAGQHFFSKYYAEPTQGPAAALKVILKGATGIMGSLPGVRHLPVMPQRLKDYGMDLVAGTRARVVADGREYRYPLLQGLHVGSIDVNLGAVRLFPFAREPRRLHVVVGAMTPLEITWKWMFLAMGRPAPGRTWHEFPGDSMDVAAEDGDVLDPVIDGELYHGFDRLEVRLGPEVTVPLIGS